jgi:glycosyltransferase involved in cell wall biosynthesis
MSRIAILGQSLWPDDAVGHDMFESARVLSGRGHEVALFAHHFDRADPRVKDARQVRGFLRGDRQAVLFYFHTIGWAEAVDVVVRARCRRLVRYHNVTPARYFARYSAALARDCREGRRQVRRLARAGCALYLPSSEYNRGELIRAGAVPGRCLVVPPFHRVDRLDWLTADVELLRELGDGRTNVLFVGRFVPSKCHAALIEAFAQYNRIHDPDSRLLLVGKEDPRLAEYVTELRRRVRARRLQGAVTFAGEAADTALKAYYLTAATFLCASRHEGFCLPLVEAMAMRVPVVARAAAAVPETVGPAGLLWERPDPAVLAESIACVAHDRAVREALAGQGWRRYQDLFSHGRIANSLGDAIEAWDRPGGGPAEQRLTYAR